MDNLIQELAHRIAQEVVVELSGTILNQKEKTNEGDFCLLTVQEAAFEFKKHPNTIRTWAKNGVIKSKRISGSLLIVFEK